MSLGQCIPGMVERGEITPEKGAEMAGLYGELEQQFRRQFGDQAAAAMATDATLKVLEGKALLKRRQHLAQVRAQQSAIKNMAAFAGGTGGKGPINPNAAVALFDRDSRAGYSNVEGRRKAVKARAHAMIDGLLAEQSRGIAGQVRNRAQLGDIVRELFGEASGNPNAKELADAWTKSADMLRQRFNAAGGDIGKLENWGLPQSHDSRAVRAAGYDAWRAAILPALDRSKMRDTRTGLAFSDEALELALRDVFETIRTDGWNSRKPGGVGTGKLANRGGDARFLIFKSADEWTAYQAKFGAGSAFDAMMGHIDGMARDIAQMEILGPNPAATVGWLKDTIERSAALDTSPNSKASERAFKATKVIDRLYDEITGAAGRPESRTMALTFSSIRSVQTAAKLGGAVLSAVTDTAFQTSTRKFNGLAATSMIPQYLKLLRPGSLADQKLAVRSGLIAEEWSQRASAQGRYMGEELTGEVSRRLAEGVLRVSGLSRWTQHGRWAFGMEFLGHITDESVKRFDKLDPAFRGALQRYGIGADAWESIRKTPLETDKGVPWLKPTNVADRALGDRLLEMILTETDYAVPMADLRTKTLLNSFAPKGTFWGEVIRSAFLFKSFGISVVLSQGRRIMEQTGPNAARYAAGLVIGTTLMGGVALQLKAIKDGKDPRPMDDPKFWGAAILQGGGFGIFGDFLSSAENRVGGGFAQTFSGPLADTAQGLVNIPQSKKPAWAAAKFARDEMPGGSLWYARLAFDRIVTDQIQEAIDPDYRKSWRRMDKRAREQGTDFYWAPGETAPERAPDFENAFGGQDR